MISTNVFKTQEGVFRSQDGASTTKVTQIDQQLSKMTQKAAPSTLTGDPIAVTLIIGHSAFIK